MIHLDILSAADVAAIHDATLRILAEVGVVLPHAGARDMLRQAGAGERDGRLCLPPDLVEGCLAKCPRQVSVRGRGGAVKTLGDGSLSFHNLGGARDIYDPAAGTFRLATLQDLRDATRILDALERCTTITPFYTPRDVPGPLMSLAMYRHALPCTTKAVQGPGVQTAAEARYAVEIAAVIGPPSETLTLSVSPVSPLTFPAHEVEAIMEIARRGIAFGPLPCPTAGTTAPFSIAGAIAQQNAEVLTAIVLVQLVRPGLPVVYCGRLAMMEPRTGISVWGGIELALASAGTVQVGHRYGLPVNVYGFTTNAHALDLQDGFERGLNAGIPALAGADEISGIGEMEAGVAGSHAQMVADDEFAASVLRLRRGVAAGTDALAVDVIAAVMGGTHNFLGQKHTKRFLKDGEVLITRLAERGTRESWERAERHGLAERARAEAERLLREYQVPPLEAAQETELDGIMEAAARELVP